MRPNIRRPLLAAASAALCVLAMAACGGGDSSGSDDTASDTNATAGKPSDQTMDQLYQAAKAAGEDKVVVYGVTPNSCYDDFSAKFPGITVQAVYMVGVTQSRLQQEHVSGQQVGDIVRTGSTTLLALAHDDLLDSFVPSTAADGIPPQFIDSAGRFIRTTQRAIGGYLYNNKKLSAADAPKSWADMVDPKFKGHIAMPDPTGPGAGLSIMQELLIKGGATDEDWAKKFAANQPALMKDQPSAQQAVESGEYWITIGGVDQTVGPAAQQKNPDVTYVFPVQGGSPLTGHFAGIVKGAPHPNAARLLETWLVSKEGQTCLVQKGNEYGVRTDGIPNPAGLPAATELPDVSGDRPVDDSELTNQTKYINLFKQIFKG